jgi:primosomal protein N' (replication factor Y)
MNKDIDIFYDEELRQRRELRFPPYRHFAALRLRAPQEAKVKKAAEDIFILLNKGKARGIEVISLSAGPQPKLRGNFYWQVLCASADARRLSAFLKKGLKDFPHSGIIVTVDMDPL